ncbi:Ribosomal protein S12 methylthiotransferase RimO [Pseudodesulfovibrio hydrargyri]|uniref:Ribosomal protein S12 methylthiotransferase RimO n=1 Tax=Pseudodesulfovibrio hydrargyri TaxID=2125990 RepID=A0A1J5N7K8_9BACT|nr:Ribosomal protein S12 methylthiotransferase RimO [Pseudodesulfovibrio hydrargyri]
MALAVPGGDKAALSALGWQSVYRTLAEAPGLAVERVFPDKLGTTEGVDPRTRESKSPLSSFPVIAWSITFEEDFLSLPRTLLAAGVPPLAAERPSLPLVVAGGPVAFLNPAPIAPFVDCFWVGEADDRFLHFFDTLRGLVFDGADREAILDAVKDMDGVYAPGRSKTPVRRITSGGQGPLTDPAFSCFISGRAAFRDTLLLEVNRGCPYGCRFCAAGYIYRPPRHAELDELKRIVEMADPPKVGLVGTALTDWPELLPFLKWLHERKKKFSLSSMRADGITEELLVYLRERGIRTITLALEGASERLRRMMSKKLDPKDFLNAVRLCARYGVNHLKIYMIAGWPGETDEDYAELADFLAEIVRIRSEEPGGRKKQFMRITIGVSSLVPKPFTPFQWAPMLSEDALNARMKGLEKLAKPYKGVTLQHDDPFQARLQGLLARGGEELAEFILLAAEHGGWKKALKLWNGDPAAILDRERGQDEPFPWEVVDIGVRRDYLWKEWERAKAAKVSPGCSARGCGQCAGCGMEPQSGA